MGFEAKMLREFRIKRSEKIFAHCGTVRAAGPL
jgi:hypothetical protein